jgi:hypothetical protein
LYGVALGSPLPGLPPSVSAWATTDADPTTTTLHQLALVAVFLILGSICFLSVEITFQAMFWHMYPALTLMVEAVTSQDRLAIENPTLNSSKSELRSDQSVVVLLSDPLTAERGVGTCAGGDPALIDCMPVWTLHNCHRMRAGRVRFGCQVQASWEKSLV